MAKARFDAIVIGAGEAGSLVASRMASAGMRVAMIYRPPFGSTCLNAGCVPRLGVVQYDPRKVIPTQISAHLTRVAGYGTTILPDTTKKSRIPRAE